jgi:hypothetical protein
MASQARAEAALAARARELGARLRFGTRCESVVQDADGVSAGLRADTGQAWQVRARYLVAADGHRGGLRERLGIGSHGRGTWERGSSVRFTADLSALAGDTAVALRYLQNPELPRRLRRAGHHRHTRRVGGRDGRRPGARGGGDPRGDPHAGRGARPGRRGARLQRLGERAPGGRPVRRGSRLPGRRRRARHAADRRAGRRHRDAGRLLAGLEAGRGGARRGRRRPAPSPAPRAARPSRTRTPPPTAPAPGSRTCG